MNGMRAKTVSFGRFESELARRHEVKRYWDGSHGRIESLRPKLAAYRLTPGRGFYIPSVAPHRVRNGPAISPFVTLTYFTSATERENMIETLNGRLRSFHLSPRQPGQSPPPTWPKWPPCEPGGSSSTYARDRSQNDTGLSWRLASARSRRSWFSCT